MGRHAGDTAITSERKTRRGTAPEGKTKIVLLVALVALVVVGALVIERSSEVRGGIQRSMVRDRADRLDLEFRSTLRRLFEPLEANLRITRRWGEQGSLDLGDHRALNSLFIPILEQYPFVSAMRIASDAGRYAPRRGGRRFPPDLGGEEALRSLIGRGEGDRLEFKSTLRWSLAANKPGKEVEIAWLKTVAAFLNSEGGILMIGVDDRGEPTGLDADGFANKDERLYVRMGPSSRQLPTSEVVRRFRRK
jgi:hypothetical protein